jgi:hypothetical protein
MANEVIGACFVRNTDGRGATSGSDERGSSRSWGVGYFRPLNLPSLPSVADVAGGSFKDEFHSFRRRSFNQRNPPQVHSSPVQVHPRPERSLSQRIYGSHLGCNRPGLAGESSVPRRGDAWSTAWIPPPGRYCSYIPGCPAALNGFHSEQLLLPAQVVRFTRCIEGVSRLISAWRHRERRKTFARDSRPAPFGSRP